MKVAVTGASGRLGRLVAETLLERLDPHDVVLISRDPDGLSEFADRGASIRFGDFDHADSLAAALSGADKLLLISTGSVGARVGQHAAAIDAARRASVRSIAYTSMINPSDSNPVFLGADHRATEDLLRGSGCEWTLLRNAMYTEMLAADASRAIVTGRLVTNAGEGRNSYVARGDCAAAAAAVLSTEGHAGKTYDITGGQALSVSDVAVLISELADVDVDVQQLDDEDWIAAMVTHAGMPEATARAYSTLGAATRAGYLAPVSHAVSDLTGRAPITAHEVLARHLADLRSPTSAKG